MRHNRPENRTAPPQWSLSCLCLALSVLALGATADVMAQTPPPDIRGIWLTPDKATVNIVPCGQRLCGHLTDFVPPPGLTKTSAVDAYNPDPSKRRRTIMGLLILSDLEQDGAAWRGRVYDPKRGILARVTAQLEGENKLTLRGCVRIVLFNACETQLWRRQTP